VTRGARVVRDVRPEQRATVAAQRAERERGCRHRGDVLRTEPCRKCHGTVLVKVLGCTVHGECTLSDKLPSVAKCRTCREWAAPLGTLEGGT
jgi:hypothetical protein